MTDAIIEEDVVYALRTRDPIRLYDCLQARPDLATRDDACISLFPTTNRPHRMPLLAAAIYISVYDNDDAHHELLDEIATRYARAHPRGSPMRMQIAFTDTRRITRTPVAWALRSFAWTPTAAAMAMRLLAYGLDDTWEDAGAHHQHSLLCCAMDVSYRHPDLITRLLQSGFRLAPHNVEDDEAIQGASHGLREGVEAGLSALLPVYAGRMVFTDPLYLARWLARQTLGGLDRTLRVLDVLRALGLRLTPEVRAVLAPVEGLLEWVDAADAVRVRRTLFARRLLGSWLPDNLRDEIASAASAAGAMPYSQQLVVVPPEVRRRHQQPPLTPPDAI
jgi:hypothetical protein